MKLDIFFRRLPPSPSLHRYAQALLKTWEKSWPGPLDLRLVVARSGQGFTIELAGRDAAGHAISAESRGSDPFQALDLLHRNFASQGQLLAPQRSPRIAVPRPFV